MGTPAGKNAQLELPWRDAGTLERELSAQTGASVSVTLTNNRSTMISFRRRRDTGAVSVRLHHMFLRAEPPVVKALSEWLRHGRRGRPGTLLDAFIRANQHEIRGAAARRIRVEPQGRYFDLAQLFDEQNQAEFEGRVHARITWGQMPTARRRRSIRLGSYTEETRLIRIHPLLDQSFVPEFVVRFIVFHEMLHADLGILRGSNGRRQMHTPEFRRRERQHPDYDRAEEWIAAPANLNRLLRPLGLGPLPRPILD